MSLQQLFNVNKEKGCVCLCGLKFKQRKAEVFPDHLSNWELWMQRRKQTHQILSAKLKCAPGDLLMNYGDTYRNIIEEKLALEYAKIETHFDKYRGNPDFWKLPLCFKNKSPPYGGTEYFCVKSKVEKNEVPTIQYVGVPDFILEEKDIVPRTRHLKNLWYKSSYRKEVMERISEKLLEIEPHKPDLSDFLIFGSNTFSRSPAPLTNDLPTENYTIKSIVKEIDHVECLDEKESEISISNWKRISLKINRIEFNQNFETDCSQNKLTVMFEYFTGSAIPCERSIIFENTGEVVLRLYLKQYNKQKLFRDFTQKTNIYHAFKFNKNELILLPGTKKKLPIWFQVEKPGNFFEYWEVKCEPKIWKSNFCLIILFKGFAFIKNYKQEVQKLSDKLNQMVRITNVKDLLNDIIHRGTYCAPHQTHSFNFSEEELFESINVVNNIGTQMSKYNYNPGIIIELKDFYKETKFPNDPKQWNLSIKKLIENARKKDLFAYFESKLNLYNAAKLSRKALQEDNLEGQNKVGAKQEKGVSKKQINPANKETIEESGHNIPHSTFYSKLNEILKTLEKPSIYKNKEREKHLFCTIILKALFWQMLEQLYKLDNISGVSIENSSECKLEVKQYHQVPDRLLYEIFDECYILRTKRISHISGTANAKPKSLLLQDLSISDLKKIHKTYFNKEEVNPKGAKPKIVNETKKSQKGQPTKTSLFQEQDLYIDINENYDPFSETFSSEYLTNAINFPEINVSSNKNPDENKYLIVYMTLCRTVNAIVDTIESFNESNIPGNILKKLQKCDVSINRAYYEKQVKKPSKETLDITVEEDFQSDYFEYLQELHWHDNMNTKKYFVEQKWTRHFEILGSKDIMLNVDNQSIKKPPENIFSLEDFRRKSEIYCLKDMAAQTDDPKQRRSITLPDQPGDTDKVTDSKNIFYFYNDNGEHSKEDK